MTSTDIYTPFTYCITFLPTGERYYGSRYANNKKEMAHPSQLWTSYFTSSNIIANLIEEHGKDAFSFEVRKTFINRAKTVSWENKFLTRINAAQSTEWLNGHNGGSNFHCTSESSKKGMSTRKKNGTCWRTPESIQKGIDTRNERGTGPDNQNIIQKMLDTRKMKGLENPMKNQETIQKAKDTRKRNGTTNTNTPESIQKCKDTKQKNGTPSPSTVPFLSIVETKKTYAKNQISRSFPSLKQYY